MPAPRETTHKRSNPAQARASLSRNAGGSVGERCGCRAEGLSRRAMWLPCGGAARGRFCWCRSARGRPTHNHCTLVCPRVASDLLPSRRRGPASDAFAPLVRDFGAFGRPVRHGGISSQPRLRSAAAVPLTPLAFLGSKESACATMNRPEASVLITILDGAINGDSRRACAQCLATRNQRRQK